MFDEKSIFSLETLSSPIVSEDGKILYFVKTIIDEKKDQYISNIYAYDIETQEETPVVEKHTQSYSPLPFKEQLLYLSKENDGIAQVYLLDLNSKKTKQLTFSQSGIHTIEKSKNSTSFIFSAKLPKTTPETFTWQNLNETASKKSSPFIRTSTLSYQTEGIGFVDETMTKYLYKQSIKTGEVTLISHQDTGYGSRRVVSVDDIDGDICFEKRLHPDSDTNHDSGLFLYKQKEGKFIHLTEKYKTGIFTEGALSPNGKWVAFIGNPESYQTRNQFRLYLCEVKTGEIRQLATDLDIQYGDNSVSDFFQNVRQPIVQWHPQSEYFYVLSSEFGEVRLKQVSLVTGEMTDISPAKGVVKEYTVDADGRIYAFLSQPENPIQLYQHKDNVWCKLTTSTEKRYEKYNFSPYLETNHIAEDGKQIHSFLTLPRDFNENKKYPLILNIHGGPYTMHAYNFFHEAQVLASYGYAVLLVNYRGSYGYGQDFTHSVYQRYGMEDYTDLMTSVDGVLHDYSWINADELFVTGGSYGGYLTNWIVTHNNRFKAAVTQRSMTNLLSMIGTSDTGYFFLTDEVGGDWSNYKRLWTMSPLAFAENVETPLLIVHSLEDHRVPFEQAQQFYASLKYYGKTAELLAFPDSNHDLSRSGRPIFRYERLKAIIEWFEQFRV